MVEKLYINGIPAYRRVEGNQYQYRLFEDTLDRIVIYMNIDNSLEEQGKLLLSMVKDMLKDKELRIIEQVHTLSEIKFDTYER